MYTNTINLLTAQRFFFNLANLASKSSKLPKLSYFYSGFTYSRGCYYY